MLKGLRCSGHRLGVALVPRRHGTSQVRIKGSCKENAKIHYDACGRGVRFKSAIICSRGTRPGR
jgi:hypothetical protein